MKRYVVQTYNYDSNNKLLEDIINDLSKEKNEFQLINAFIKKSDNPELITLIYSCYDSE